MCHRLLLVASPRPWKSKIGDGLVLGAWERAILAAWASAGLISQTLLVQPNEEIGVSRAFGWVDGLVEFDRGGTLLEAGAPAVPDWLVCCHGSRDACCGKFGPQLVHRIRGDNPQLRVWEVSHLGGHRFAPTAWHLPSWQLFGRLPLNAPPRSWSAQGLTDCLRGHAAFPPALQVLRQSSSELVDLVALLDGARGFRLLENGPVGAVELERWEIESESGQSWTAEMAVTTFCGPQSCRDIPSDGKATSRSYSMVAIRRGPQGP